MSALLIAAAEPSKVPFYILGGLFVGWSGVLALVGLSQPKFPGNVAGQRLVILVSFCLALGAVLSAVLTSK